MFMADNCRFKKVFFSYNKKTGKTQYRCRNCGLRVRSPNPAHRIHANCRRYKPLSFLEKLKNYVGALVMWYRLGKLKRGKKEIERIYSICSSCEYFSSDSCKLCGCKVSQKLNPLINKIAMGTQHCPKGEW